LLNNISNPFDMLLILENFISRLYKNTDVIESKPTQISRKQWIHADRIVIGLLFISVVVAAIVMS
jgi:hypothetical protein